MPHSKLARQIFGKLIKMTNTLKRELTEKLEKFIAKRFSTVKNVQFLSEAYSDFLLLDSDDGPPKNSMLRLLEHMFFKFEVETLDANLLDDGPEFLMSLSGPASKAEHSISCQFLLSFESIEIKSIEIVKDEVLDFEKINESEADQICSYMQSMVEWDYVSPRKLPEFLKN